MTSTCVKFYLGTDEKHRDEGREGEGRGGQRRAGEGRGREGTSVNPAPS